MELALHAPKAFVLAYIIAYRARWRGGFNVRSLGPGEALLGDYEACGFTRREYRTAVDNLRAWGFATFRTTNRGTIAKLIDTRLFSVLSEPNDQPNGQQGANKRPAEGQQPTNRRPSSDHQRATNIEGIERIEGLEGVEGIEKKAAARRGVFSKPGMAELKLQAAKIGLPDSEAEKFFNYYESNGWKVGRNPMRSWQAAMVNWRKNWEERRPRPESKQVSENLQIPIL